MLYYDIRAMMLFFVKEIIEFWLDDLMNVSHILHTFHLDGRYIIIVKINIRGIMLISLRIGGLVSVLIWILKKFDFI
jgi:hypothetical protein